MPIVPPHECPDCSSKNVVTRQVDHEFEYGSDEDKVLLKVNIPVQVCRDCDSQWTGHVAEKIMHERVLQHHFNLKEGYKYLFVCRGTLKGIMVASWHEITPNDQETKATMFGMKMSSKMNMGSGICMVKSEIPLDADQFQNHLRTLNQVQLDKFIKDSSLEHEQ